jgi:hypothetical protein
MKNIAPILVQIPDHQKWNFSNYVKQVEQLVAEGKTSGAEQTAALIEYTKLNLHRMQKWNKVGALRDTDKAILSSQKQKQYWYVLAESWCGDAAQIVPFLSKIAEGSEGKMALTILFRDEQVELMNEFLTNGTRSIPKLIATDEGGNVLFQWGPRPKRAQDLMLSLKQNPELSAEQAKMQLHKWYAENKGADVLDELMEHIQLSETAVLG